MYDSFLEKSRDLLNAVDLRDIYHRFIEYNYSSIQSSKTMFLFKFPALLVNQYQIGSKIAGHFFTFKGWIVPN